jgi:integrase
MRADYRLITRKNKAGKVYFQARFIAPDGSTSKTKSYPTARTPAQAARLAEADLKAGVIAPRRDPPAIEYIREFWTPAGAYARGRALRGEPLSMKYLRSGLVGLKHYALFLEGLTMSKITPQVIEKAILELADQGIGARSINLGLEAVRRPVAIFCHEHRMANPILEVEKVKEHHRERGILSPEELSRVIALRLGLDPRARLAFLLGALCGLRKGEVRGLMIEDVDQKRGVLNIRHNIVLDKEGLKGPKAGSVRMVPAPGVVLDAITYLAERFPGSPFAIPHLNERGKPCPCLTIDRGFRRILGLIGIQNEERHKRNLCFHGLRHAFVSLSRSSGIPDYIVMRLAGHKSASMMENYSHIENVFDFEEAKRKMDERINKKALEG